MFNETQQSFGPGERPEDYQEGSPYGPPNYAPPGVRAYPPPLANSNDPTLDWDYVLGGGSQPTYTPPNQWNRNEPTNWTTVMLIGAAVLLGLGLISGGRR